MHKHENENENEEKDDEKTSTFDSETRRYIANFTDVGCESLIGGATGVAL